MKFRLIAYLLQPRADDGAPMAHEVRARWVTGSGTSDQVIDGALADRRSRVLEVHRPPDGVGTTWQVDVESVRYAIEDSWVVRNRLQVLRLSLSTTDSTGEILLD